ncbi:ring-cleaving dioxygenase [Methylobacterium sp. J-078]|uniref:ring-cleaving dioxygenase n=1 Tax=Methylobacterium sp. J-078 TaxID=2836657 RepID=UPI001FBC01A3|nr:ring-cleaving dioxygenase [Methylobacterium sp. J-078]MCJ2045899.1 ring-cleaving dioxygenase [Methylobacterium sp. J-078]
MQLTGIHHLTAITAQAADNLAFYTRVLGLRLVKKTVNQDDVSAYHLFYADGLASPGTDITFFDWPAPQERRGTNSISRTALRVAGPAAIDWWREHLARQGVTHAVPVERDGRLTLDFEDGEGQRLMLVDDGGAGEAHPWAQSPVPAEHQIRGLGPIRLSVAQIARTEAVLTEVLGMSHDRDYELPEGEVRVYRMGAGGPAAEIHLVAEPKLAPARQGAGAVHHVAFRIPDADYDAWADRLKQRRVPSSGPVDRYYFRSLYFREPNGILFEIATDGPGFATDEPMETLGERLALPPFLEGRRAEIEAGLKPL